MVVLALAAALIAGALVTVQTGSNARLKEALGEPLPAVVVSSLLGIVLLVVVGAVARVPLPAPGRLVAAPWSAWLGGLVGAIYAVTVVVLARSFGAATLTALVIAGQLVCSVVLDHFGLIGFQQHPASAGRVLGCLLMLAGIVLIWKF